MSKIQGVPGNDSLTSGLNISQTNTYLYILNKVVDHKACTSSNRELSEALKISISTVEKHLNFLDKKGLIERDTVRGINPFSLRWETKSRTITIPASNIDPMILASLHVQRVNNLLDMITTPEATKKMIKKMKEVRGTR